MTGLPVGAQAHRDVLASDKPWYWLYEIEVPTEPPTRYRLVSAIDGTPDEPIQFGFSGAGLPLTYYPFPVSHGPIRSDTDASLSDANLTIANISREIQGTIDAYDMVGQEVVIRLVHKADLASGSAAAEQSFQITGIEWSARWVTAGIGQFSTLRRSFPARLGMRHHCGFLYRGPRCGYVAAGLPTCDKTLLGGNGCVVHGAQELAEGLPVRHPERFGGFPGMPRPQ